MENDGKFKWYTIWKNYEKLFDVFVGIFYLLLWISINSSAGNYHEEASHVEGYKIKNKTSWKHTHGFKA